MSSFVGACGRVSREPSNFVTQSQSRTVTLLGSTHPERVRPTVAGVEVARTGGTERVVFGRSRMDRADHASSRPSSRPRPLRAVVIGPPGAGQSTQCAALSDHLGTSHVSIGDRFREANAIGSALGSLAGRFVARGLLVPDKIVLRMVCDTIRSCELGRTEVIGFLLDGAPHTLRQAATLDVLMPTNPIDAVIHLHVPDEVVRARLCARNRTEDTPTVSNRRLTTYHRVTVPMVTWMANRRPVLDIDGNRPINDVSGNHPATRRISSASGTRHAVRPRLSAAFRANVNGTP